MKRRTLLKTAVASGVAAGSGVLTACDDPAAESSADSTQRPGGGYLMPAEGAEHSVTWMAYGATPGVWGEDTTSAYGRDLRNARLVARQDLLRLAATISRFEPVAMLVNSAADEAEAQRFLAAIVAETSVKDKVGASLDASGRIYLGMQGRPGDLPPVQTHPLEFVRMPLNDLWARDTAPVFVADGNGKLAGVNLNFNGWGQWPLTTGLTGWRKDPAKTAAGIRDQPIARDRTVAASIAADAKVPVLRTWLTMEGGGLEVNGKGLAIATESCILNRNRNPGRSKAQVEAELRRLFGVEQVLWMRGRPGIELTDWHVDFLARFSSPDNLVYVVGDEPEDRRDATALQAAVEKVNGLPLDRRTALLAGGNKITMHELPHPELEQVFDAFDARNAARPITERPFEEFSETTAAGYVGYYEANGCVVMAQFGDVESDRTAYEQVAGLYPDRMVVQITTDGLAVGGGTIHCATQQQPAV